MRWQNDVHFEKDIKAVLISLFVASLIRKYCNKK